MRHVNVDVAAQAASSYMCARPYGLIDSAHGGRVRRGAVWALLAPGVTQVADRAGLYHFVRWMRRSCASLRAASQ